MSNESERRAAHIRSAPDVAEAVKRAAQYVGVKIEHGYQAKAIAEAARSFPENVVGVRQMAHRPQWEEAGFRDYLRQSMRRELLEEITSAGLLPVALPVERLRYVADSFLSPDCGREVPEDSPSWDTVFVVLEAGVRIPPVDRKAAVKAGMLGGKG